jgi:hypothetical protein
MTNITKQAGLDGLKLLDFPVERRPIYLATDSERTGHEVKEIDGHVAIVRPDSGAVLGLVSDQYKLVTHKQSLDPYLDKLGREGWTVNEVRLERAGAKAYVELHNKHEVKAVRVGDPVGKRLLLWNTYDGTTAVAAQGGYFVLICLNGATAPAGFLTGSSIRHSGDPFRLIDESAEKFGHQFEEVIDLYRGLADKVVSPEISRAVIQEVCGIRKLDLVTAYWKRGHNGSDAATAWNLYNAITKYLTHDFGGQIAVREAKNRDAVDLLVNPEKVRLLIEAQAREKAAQN